MNENIKLRQGVVFGKDANSGAFRGGIQSGLPGAGAHESWRLDLEGEDWRVYPSMQFLKAFNLRGGVGARHVGIVGGGNSAVDAAAWRCGRRKSRASRSCTGAPRQMPAYEEEVEAALEEA